MKTKTFLSLIAITGLTACAGTPQWKNNITPESEYKINSVKTEIKSLCPAPNFMTEKEISDEFAKTVKKTFCEKNKCTDVINSNTVVMDINLKYHRTFMAEVVSCSESFAVADISYSFDLKKDGHVFYSRPQVGPFAPQRGLFGNLGRIATQLSFTGGPDKEKSDLEYLMPGVAGKISEDLE